MSDPIRDAQDRFRLAQEQMREAQERAAKLAREVAQEAEERTKAVRDAMPPGLPLRLLSAFIGIPLILALIFVEVWPERFPGIVFTLGVALIALICAGEYFRALKHRFRPNERLAYIGVVVLQFAAWNVSRGRLVDFLPVMLVVLTIMTLINQVLRRESEPVANLGVTLFGVAYVGWLLSYLIFLRSLLPGKSIEIPLPWGHGPRVGYGAWLTLYVLAVTWMTDTGAYAFGVRFGKNSRKLAPSLSPNKTVVGAIGGLITATVTSLLWGAWAHLPWYHCLILGPILGALGQVGDLCESAIKRDLGIKDFGGIMPGHGGLLDRFDSLLFTAPIAYYYLALLVVRYIGE
ncbi:phosphatidate cytidylyltransferase [Armatimonas rosea]|uniref:Phosphatidate cytidylyltransferase n=1 Tax=Armatimonas rosea TaxID=685828 RepID=A0A7W9SPM1_ARMRO|nr:phosphatidate cytidylyltransferase [Armatimonas rosea]MBB6049679.1 phosphatidate cytidylyltransferase [Armatimonas rosea]